MSPEDALQQIRDLISRDCGGRRDDAMIASPSIPFIHARWPYDLRTRKVQLDSALGGNVLESAEAQTLHWRNRRTCHFNFWSLRCCTAL